MRHRQRRLEGAKKTMWDDVPARRPEPVKIKKLHPEDFPFTFLDLGNLDPEPDVLADMDYMRRSMQGMMMQLEKEVDLVDDDVPLELLPETRTGFRKP